MDVFSVLAPHLVISCVVSMRKGEEVMPVGRIGLLDPLSVSGTEYSRGFIFVKGGSDMHLP